MAELGLTGRGIAKASGGLMTHGTAAKLVNATHSSRLDERTVMGLARAIEVPEAQIRRALGMPAKRPPFQLPARADMLNDRQRRALLNLVDVMLTPEVASGKGRESTAGLRAVARGATSAPADAELGRKVQRARDANPDAEKRR